MRPTALEILRGVRALLLEDVLPEATAPHLRAQVGLAVGLLDAAAAELEDAPAAYAAERARMIALARVAAPIVARRVPAGLLAQALAGLAAAPVEPPDQRLSALMAESERLSGVLDQLAVFCDEDGSEDAAITSLREQVIAEAYTQVARRLRWTGGGPPG